MKTLNRQEIESRLDLTTCLELMRNAFLNSANGVYENSSKLAHVTQYGFMGVMMSSEKNGSYSVTKVIGKGPKALSSHEGKVLLYEEGKLVGDFEAGIITALRTAATSALATDVLASKEASMLTLIGAGEAAYYHALAICTVRDIKSITIVNRTFERADLLKRKLEKVLPLIKIEISHLMNKDSDIITLMTPSSEPLIHHKDISKSCHINTIGSCLPGLNEVSRDIMETAHVIVDDIKIARVEAGNLQRVKLRDCFELGVVLKEKPQFTKDITVFNSTGVAFQDLVCAKYLL